jgi:hypothetical protein
MRENEFENKVQQKMDGFRIRPDEAVWMQVERRIRKEKKRRFIFWWFFIPFLLAGGIGAGIWVTNRSNSNNKKISSVPGTTAANKNATMPVTPSGIPGAKYETDDSSHLSIIKSGNNTTAANSISEPVLNKDNNTNLNKMKLLTGTKDNNSQLPDNSVFTTGAGAKKKKATREAQQTNKPAIPGPVSENPISQMSTKPVVDETMQISSVVGLPVSAGQLATPLPGETNPVNDSANKKPVAELSVSADTTGKPVEVKTNQKKQNWHWGIYSSVGRSAIVDPLSFGAHKLSARFDATGGGSINNPIVASTSLPAMRYATSFNTGAFAVRQLSAKLKLEISAGYTYLSSQMDIGKRIDSARNVNNQFSDNLPVNNFYRPASLSIHTTYTNQFHYFELAAALSWRISNGKKFKLDWKNGIGYGQLLASNMLHYDGSLPGYYKDNTLLRKSQVFFSTGLSFPVHQRWTINPYIMYSLTPVLKSAAADKAHLANFSTRLQFLLNKK